MVAVRRLCVVLVASFFLGACARPPSPEQPQTPSVRFQDAFTSLPPNASQMVGGIAYVDVAVGAGRRPEVLHDVTVDYSVWLSNGTPIDSSGGRTPMTFTYGTSQMIRGFEEGIRSMREGGRRRFLVPGMLAYPRDGAPGVPARTPLLFDVRLLEVSTSSNPGTDGIAR